MAVNDIVATLYGRLTSALLKLDHIFSCPQQSTGGWGQGAGIFRQRDSLPWVYRMADPAWKKLENRQACE